MATCGSRRRVEANSRFAFVRGRRYEVRAEVGLDEADVREGLRSFLLAVPRDAAHAGVSLAADGTPSEEDIARVAGNMVHLTLHPCRGD